MLGIRAPLALSGLLALSLLDGGGAAADGPGAGKAKDEKVAAKIKIGFRDPDLMKRVDAAVSKATEWLMKEQKPDGHWESGHDNAPHGPFPHGATCLSLLAAIHGGVPPVDDRIEKGFKWCKDRWDNWMAGGRILHTGVSWRTYEVGILLMAIEAKARWKPHTLASVHGTQANMPKVKMTPQDWEWVKQLRDFLVDNVVVSHVLPGSPGKNGGMPVSIDVKDAWSYPDKVKTKTDRSNMQYAILGLKSASRMAIMSRRADLRPPMDLWVLVVKNFLKFQETTGPKVSRVILDEKEKKRDGYAPTVSSILDEARGWGYAGANMPTPGSDHTAATGSMTTVGIASVELIWSELEAPRRPNEQFGWSKDDLKLGEDALKDLRQKYEKSVHDGVAWMDKHWSVEKNPEHPSGSWHYYYLYGLERAGVLSDRWHFGAHDWYREGAEYLLKNQRGAMWDSGKGDGPLCSTCFAILFLTKATVPVKAAGTG
ncbi:MAG: hypothetical protein L0216_19535 [Planctomycetales bacterium]|nr:hypothetical protein [Planctomycetales bacterium]